jgi:hypothetical protein
MGSKVQRFFTRCDFDHVAIVLKYKNDKIVLFESTGTSVSKVILSTFRELIYCHGVHSSREDSTRSMKILDLDI